MEIRDVLTNIKKYDAWDYKNYPLRKDEADAIIENYKEPCEDCISRAELLKYQYRIDDSATLSTRDVVNVEDIEELPSVQPIRPKGEWIEHEDNSGQLHHLECSSCHNWHRDLNKDAFCPNCGADMRGKE